MVIAYMYSQKESLRKFNTPIKVDGAIKRNKKIIRQELTFHLQNVYLPSRIYSILCRESRKAENLTFISIFIYGGIKFTSVGSL